MDSYVVPSYLRNVRQLTIHDDEYHRILYSLQVSLRSTCVKILSIHALHCPQQDALFESRNTGSTVLDSWVNSNDLPEDNTVWNIVHHGGHFRITDPNKGAVFSSGIIPFATPRLRESGPQRYEFLHSRIATGRSYVLERDQLGKHGIPAGYDTIKVANTRPSTENVSDVELYNHTYVINDERKIYADFVVNFLFDVAVHRIPHAQAEPKCENCEARPATVYCLQDDAKLCDPCDREIHARKIAERHQRMPVHDIVNTLGMTLCRDHKGVPVQFFDAVSHVPVCIHCRMTGSHSSEENAAHELVPIHEAYKATMRDVEQEADLIEQRRQLILQQLDSIDRRKEGVRVNHEQVQEQIYDVVQRVVQLLHEETQCKLTALSSDEEELRRQLEYFEWMDAFGAYCSRTMNPVDFLQMYKSHSQLLAMAPSEIVDGAANVRPDIRIVGKLALVVDEDGRHPKALLQASGKREAAVSFSNNGSGGGVAATPSPVMGGAQTPRGGARRL